MDDAAGGVAVRFDHGGTTWEIPDHLVRTQQEWDRADRQARQAAQDGDDSEWNTARARRLELTAELYAHPWLRAAMDSGRRYQADQALKAAARDASIHDS
jgi:hypothetical protein